MPHWAAWTLLSAAMLGGCLFATSPDTPVFPYDFLLLAHELPPDAVYQAGGEPSDQTPMLDGLAEAFEAEEIPPIEEVWTSSMAFTSTYRLARSADGGGSGSASDAVGLQVARFGGPADQFVEVETEGPSEVEPCLLHGHVQRWTLGNVMVQASGGASADAVMAKILEKVPELVETQARSTCPAPKPLDGDSTMEWTTYPASGHATIETTGPEQDWGAITLKEVQAVLAPGAQAPAEDPLVWYTRDGGPWTHIAPPADMQDEGPVTQWDFLSFCTQGDTGFSVTVELEEPDDAHGNPGQTRAWSLSFPQPIACPPSVGP